MSVALQFDGFVSRERSFPSFLGEGVHAFEIGGRKSDLENGISGIGGEVRVAGAYHARENGRFAVFDGCVHNMDSMMDGGLFRQWDFDGLQSKAEIGDPNISSCDAMDAAPWAD